MSFHVGSQQKDPRRGTRRFAEAAGCSATWRRVGIELGMVNLGGGFPTPYRTAVPEAAAYGVAIMAAVRRHFGNRLPVPDRRAGPRPGRQRRRDPDRGRADRRQAATTTAALGLSRHRQVRRPRRDHGRGDPVPDPHARATARPKRVILAGPTCDSADVLYEQAATASARPADRRPARDPRRRRLHHHLRRGRLQRLRAAGAVLYLRISRWPVADRQLPFQANISEYEITPLTLHQSRFNSLPP